MSGDRASVMIMPSAYEGLSAIYDNLIFRHRDRGLECCARLLSERQVEKRSIGLGPEHDWSSHAADAFGYMAIAYEEPPVKWAAGDQLHRAWALTGRVRARPSADKASQK